MNNIILLVFDSSDLKTIPSAVAALKKLGVKSLWVLHNPHLGLSYPAAASKIDAEIVTLETAKQQALAREDYTSAGKYRDDANALRVSRDLAIKESFKALKPAELTASYAETFALFDQEHTGAENILIEAMPDPLAKNQAFQYLAGQASNWIDQFPHGEYAVVWIHALGNADVVPVPASKAITAPKVRQEYTEEVLAETHYVPLRAIAKDLNIEGSEKMNKAELIPAILTAQYAAASNG